MKTHTIRFGNEIWICILDSIGTMKPISGPYYIGRQSCKNYS
jgi:hypothetical protein